MCYHDVFRLCSVFPRKGALPDSQEKVEKPMVVTEHHHRALLLVYSGNRLNLARGCSCKLQELEFKVFGAGRLHLRSTQPELQQRQAVEGWCADEIINRGS